MSWKSLYPKTPHQIIRPIMFARLTALVWPSIVLVDIADDHHGFFRNGLHEFSEGFTVSRRQLAEGAFPFDRGFPNSSAMS